jgi:hypothetical protein
MVKTRSPRGWAMAAADKTGRIAAARRICARARGSRPWAVRDGIILGSPGKRPSELAIY